ncbi:MAG: hypothetical protein WAQ52_13755 [Terriglobales bacterium]
MLLLYRGPNDPAVRSHVRLHADAIRLMFEMERPTNLEEARQYVHALEILRDAGVESSHEVKQLREYGWAVVEFYRADGDLLNLAGALQAFANLCRLDEDEVSARRMTRRAWHILNEKYGRSDDPNALMAVHQSTFWDLRLFAQDLEERSTQNKREQLIRLAERVNTPGIWIETRRELAGYWTIRREYDEAREQLQALEDLQNLHPRLPTYGAPTLLRPKVELLLDSGGKDEVMSLIEKYADLYRKDPHLHYYRQLKKWKREYGLSLQVPDPVYASPILIYLPRVQ